MRPSALLDELLAFVHVANDRCVLLCTRVFHAEQRLLKSPQYGVRVVVFSSPALTKQLEITADSLAASCAIPIQQLEAVAGTFLSAIERGVCADVNGMNATLYSYDTEQQEIMPVHGLLVAFVRWSKTDQYFSERGARSGSKAFIRQLLC